MKMYEDNFNDLFVSTVLLPIYNLNWKEMKE